MSPRMGGSRFIHCPGKQIAVLTTRPAEAGGIAYKTDALSPSEVVSELNALLQAAPRGLTRALTDRGSDLTPDVLTGGGSVPGPFLSHSMFGKRIVRRGRFMLLLRR